MGRAAGSSPSSSFESSSNHYFGSGAASSSMDFGTDLRLGLSISASPPYAREQQPMLRQVLGEEDECNSATLFVKVYMEGIPIGRKLSPNNICR
ncbi:auxin-responsive protein IAA4-like [Hibiscus syriacus]|uniref:auxin-responsive protein IAA4-like n=1 Tax=Hibiscus syriacus TaxID=106335 RepID=UPI0019242A67|nr:auxin-responsive protein IAA4-like [Hibiscus syriacus]